MIVVLLALMIGFLIWKSFVISNTTNNKRLVNSEKIIKPIDTEGLADIERPADAEGLADIEKSIVIYYKQQS